MKVVLDTNVIIKALSSHSKFAEILDKLFLEKYSILINNDILFEYEEVISRFYNKQVAKNFLEFILLLDNCIRIETYYQFNLIPNDEDDNKFVDIAINGNANFIVSDDKHFNILNTINFPKVQVYSSTKFLDFLN